MQIELAYKALESKGEILTLQELSNLYVAEILPQCESMQDAAKKLGVSVSKLK